MSRRPAQPPDPTAAADFRWPLVPFERLMLSLDRPQFPNHLAIRLHLRGRVQPALAAQALAAAVARHPLANVVLDTDRRHFVPAPAATVLAQQPLCADWPAVWRALDRSRPQFLAEIAPQLSRWTIASPHAWTDGLGGLQFVQDWLALYAGLVDPSAAPPLPPLEPGRLAERGRVYGTRGFAWRKIRYQSTGLFGAAKFLWRRPTTLTPLADRALELPAEFPVLRHLRIPRDQLQRLRHVGRNWGAGQAAVVLSSLFVAIARSAPTAAGSAEREWIRLLVPLTTRTRADRRLPACNQATFVQIDRRPAQLTDLAELVRRLARELRVIRRGDLERILLLALRCATFVPGQIQRWAAAQKRRGTCLATYLGRGFTRWGLPRINGGYRVGDLELHDVELLSPLLAGLPVSWAFLEFAGDLIVSLHVDPRVVPPEVADRLLAEFQRALQEFAEWAPRTAAPISDQSH